MQIIQEILDITNTEVEQDILLSKVDAEDYTNKKKSEILKQNPNFFEKKKLDFWNFSCPNGETYSEVYDRFIKFVDKHKNFNKNMIILTHGCGVRFLTSILSGMEKNDYMQEKSTNINQNYFYCWDFDNGMTKL